MSAGVALGKRLALAGVVALLVVLGAVLLATLSGPGATVAEGPDHPEYGADRIAPDRVDAGGEIDPDGDVGVVLFDQTNDNRFEREDVAPLTRAITRAGGEIRFTPEGGNLGPHLEEADVLVVVDPGREYAEPQVRAIQQFVDDGGRLLVFGEPNRMAVSGTGLQAQLTMQRSMLTTLGSAFDISFGSAYLYDMAHNDGNFKAILADSAGGDSTVDGVDRVTMYTATSVEAEGGSVLLRTGETAERSENGPQRAYPVAVRTAGESVIAVGDTTFLSEPYYSVADNDAFIERLIEFMAGADRSPDGASVGAGGVPDVSSGSSIPGAAPG